MSPVTEKFLKLSVTGDRATPVIGDILAGTRRVQRAAVDAAHR
jgi:hypothetical protein